MVDKSDAKISAAVEVLVDFICPVFVTVTVAAPVPLQTPPLLLMIHALLTTMFVPPATVILNGGTGITNEADAVLAGLTP
jgi:hypothetical protein